MKFIFLSDLLLLRFLSPHSRDALPVLPRLESPRIHLTASRHRCSSLEVHQLHLRLRTTKVSCVCTHVHAHHLSRTTPRRMNTITRPLRHSHTYVLFLKFSAPPFLTRAKVVHLLLVTEYLLLSLSRRLLRVCCEVYDISPSPFL